MKRIFWPLIAMGTLVLIWFFFFRENTIVHFPTNGTNIIAFGDSLVQGVGATGGS